MVVKTVLKQVAIVRKRNDYKVHWLNFVAVLETTREIFLCFQLLLQSGTGKDKSQHGILEVTD